MKTARPWELKDEIYSLCNRKQYFTGGTNSQYDKLFYMADKPEFSCRDLAVLIWSCSITADLDEVQEELESICETIEKEEAEAEAWRKEQEALESLGMEIAYY